MQIELKLRPGIDRNDSYGRIGKEVKDFHECKVLIDNQLRIYNTGNLDLGETKFYFDDVMCNLINHIEISDYVMGCVYWIGENGIFNALKKCKGVSIITQKANHINEDIIPAHQTNNIKYAKRHSDACKYLSWLDSRIACPRGYELCSLNDEPVYLIDPIRCMGIYSGDRKEDSRISPLMHHKFLIFGNLINVNNGTLTLKIDAVWSGSMNFTVNSSRSFNDAQFHKGEEVAEAFLKRYRKILLLSEPIRWNGGQVSPDYKMRKIDGDYHGQN